MSLEANLHSVSDDLLRIQAWKQNNWEKVLEHFRVLHLLVTLPLRNAVSVSSPDSGAHVTAPSPASTLMGFFFHLGQFDT